MLCLATIACAQVDRLGSLCLLHHLKQAFLELLHAFATKQKCQLPSFAGHGFRTGISLKHKAVQQSMDMFII